jgi:hypothetical protein
MIIIGYSLSTCPQGLVCDVGLIIKIQSGIILGVIIGVIGFIIGAIVGKIKSKKK